MINQATINSALINGPGTTPGTVLELPLVQVSAAPSGGLELLLRQFSVLRATPALPLEQESHHPRAAPALQLTQVSYATGAMVINLRQGSTEAPAGSGDPAEPESTIWRLVVMLDGIDISASLIGEWSVDAEEGAARVAEFAMLPDLGTIDPTDWVRKPISIDYAVLDAAGAIRWQQRLFTGIVDVPEYDPATRITLFRCTSRLQEVFEQSDAAGIDAQIGGYWSEHIFEAEADGWRRAGDRLSTIPASLDMDAGGAIHVTDWAAKASADYTFDGGGHIDQTRRLELANSRDIHNRVRIRFDFRFQRLRQREVQRNWMMSPGIGCDFLQNPFTLPQRSMIESAAEATGWALQSISFVDLPPPQYFHCTPVGGGASYLVAWGFKILGNLRVPNAAAHAPLCQGAYIKLGKRWAQTVTEQYQIDVRAPQSIARLGEIGREDQGGVEAEQEIDGWESSLDYDAPVSGAILHRNGDHAWDADQGVDDGRVAMETAIRTLQAIHRTAILGAHRRNSASWRTLIQPQIELRHTLRMNTAELTAKGKVQQLVHQGAIDSGEATTELRIALSRSGTIGAAGDDPLDPPAAPDTQVDALPDPGPGLSYGGAGMHIGGTTDAPGFNEDWTGFVTNYGWDPTVTDPFSSDPDLPQTVVYPVQFRVQVPDIEETSRQAVEAGQTQTINVDIPLDELQVA